MRLLFPVAAALMVAVALPAAAQQMNRGFANTYPQQAGQQYMADCMKQAGGLTQQLGQQAVQGYCGCMYTYIQQRVPFNAYRQADQMVRNGQGRNVDRAIQTTLEQGAQTCMQQHIMQGVLGGGGVAR